MPVPFEGTQAIPCDNGGRYMWGMFDGTNFIAARGNAANGLDVDVTRVAGDQYTTPTHTAVSVGVASGVALAANAARLYALLINDSDTTIYLKFNAAAVLNQGIRLNANGGSYEMSKALGNLYAGEIRAIASLAAKNLLVLEGA